MEKVGISQEMVKMEWKKMPNWKAPGKDGVQGYWLKNLTSLHPRIAVQLNHILDGERPSPDWVCLKDQAKGSAADNYRPIPCILLMWKLMTAMLAGKMCSHLERENVLPSEQKGCRKGSHGTKDQLLIDKTVLRDCKRRHTNLGMAWIDCKKVYDMVPHSWISGCFEMFGIGSNVQDFLNNIMKPWKLELNAPGENIGKVDIRRGIFQGDSLSTLLFVLRMVLLTWLLRRAKAGYECGNTGFKLKHLLFMDDLNLFAKCKNQTGSLVQTVHIFSGVIGMQFGVKKCGVLISERGKVIRTNVVRLPDGQDMKDIDEAGYICLGILETDKIKEKEMKENFSKEYMRRLRLILRSKLNGRNRYGS